MFAVIHFHFFRLRESFAFNKPVNEHASTA